MKHRRIISWTIIVALLLPAAGLAEELGEMDLYAPEIYGEAYIEEARVKAPMPEAAGAEPMSADAPMDDAVSASDPVSVSADAPVTAADVPMDDAASASDPVSVSADAPVTAADAPMDDAVSASDPAPIAAVQTVALTKKKATARANAGESLQIAVKEGETGKFTSKSPKLATVDANGLVKALAKGTAKIEFKPKGGKKRTLSISIVDPYEPTGVRIAQGKSLTLNVGDVLQLNAVLAPDAARTTLTWKSSKAKAAAVNNDGVVTARGEGKAKLTVTTANKKKASITIKVVDPYKPTGVSIAQGKSLTLNVGDVLQLNAVLAPDAARTTLKWKSDKAKVAAVDGDGVVTARSEGKAKLTVTTANKKKATVTIKVVDPYKPTGVSIDQGGALTLNKGEGVQLSAALAPENARTTLKWKSSNAKVATVDANGYLATVGTGKATITVTTGNGISDALRLQVNRISNIPGFPEMNLVTYNGEAFNVVNTDADPIAYQKKVFDRICTSPGRTGKYSGYCLGFCYYYVSCMVDNVTDPKLSVALKKYMTSKKLRYSTENYSNPKNMMARLYDLLNAGLPQILMVEAITHPGSRHFVAVIGYRSSVTRREDLRPEDLLIIDSFDGKLESMDPAIDPIETRVIFKQKGKYRIEAVRFK